MACLDRYLLVAGGLSRTAAGQAIHRQDCCIYDPAANAWDVLTDTAFEPDPADSRGRGGSPAGAGAAADGSGISQGKRPGSSGGSTGSRMPPAQPSPRACFQGAGTCAFANGRLLLLKPFGDGAGGVEGAAPGAVSELWSVELQLPSDIEQGQQRAAQRTTTTKELTLRAELVASTSVR